MKRFLCLLSIFLLTSCVDIDSLRTEIDALAEKLEKIEQNLYHPEIPPIDMVVRTSGEQRISGFMLWRMAYSEMLFLDKKWPDMTKEDVGLILEDFASRNRRFGK